MEDKLKEREEKILTLESDNRMLRTENELYEKKIREIQEDQQKMYLIMFHKGQQAANADIREELDEGTEDRIVLKFLHDAFYYYLTRPGSTREHLQVRINKIYKMNSNF